MRTKVTERVARKRTRPKTEAASWGGLTGKQLAWVDAYIGNAAFNATEAARQAGYTGGDAALGVTGHRTLRNAKVREEVARRIKDRGMDADVVLDRLAQLILGGVHDLIEVDDKGAMRFDWLKLKRSGRMAAVKKVKPSPDAEPEVEWHDKLGAIEKMCKILGLLDRTAESSADNPMIRAFRELLDGPDGKGRGKSVG
jgi:hypothetical protein